MLVSTLFFLIVSSGSVFGSAYYRKRFEETLPISVSLVIIILYFSGLLGLLRLGAYIVFVVSFLLLCFAFIRVVTTRQIHEFAACFFTPGFAIALLVYMLVNYANVGKLAYSWDEFSHWADVVKAMVTIDDLASNPTSQSLFKSYPPAMPLFQYSMQVLNQVVTGSSEFVEWRLYVCYQFATYSYLIYFAKDLSWNRFGHTVAFAILVLLLPSMYFSFFDTLYIDAFLGVVAGCSLMYCLSQGKLDKYRVLLIPISMACLSLTKDVGVYFAYLVGIVYVYKGISQATPQRRLRESLPYIAIAVVAVFGAKLSWSAHLASREVPIIFGQAVSVRGFFDVLLYGSSTDYRWVALHNFWRALFEKRLRLGSTGFSISISLAILLLFLGIVASLLYEKKLQKKQNLRGLGAIIVIFSGFYLLGMCLMYMYKFTEYEAVRLASMERYVSILTTMLGITLLLTLMKLLSVSGNVSLRVIAVIVAVLVCPVGPIRSFVLRNYVNASIATRSTYNDSINLVEGEISSSPARIWVVSQEDTGFDYWVLRYSLRPNTVNPGFTWSVGIPFFEGDVWTYRISAEEWIDSLVDEFDYVLLYKVNDYFIEEFGELFNNSEYIGANSLFVVDPQKRMLIQVSN